MEYTEEVNKAIEAMKDKLDNDENSWFYYDEIETIFDLLEKQQKEIERLKEYLTQYHDGKLFTSNQLKRIEREQNKYYIHKDKIREKIEDIEERIEEENEMLERNQICKEDYESRVKYLNYALNIYKRLLGDE